MVAMFIGAIGVLNRTQMDKFADIFLAYQKRGKSKDPAGMLAPSSYDNLSPNIWDSCRGPKIEQTAGAMDAAQFTRQIAS